MQSYPSQLNIPETLATATAHHQAGRLPQAEQLYRQILQQQPQQVDALNLLGVIACQKGGLDEGITLYRQALMLRPGYVSARENLSVALWKRGKQLIEEAIDSYSQIITFQPENQQAYHNLGSILVEQGKLDEALSYYLQAVSVQPDDAVALNTIGTLLQQQGKTSAAIAYHRRALAIRPHYPDALNSLGTALQEDGNTQEALSCFNQALALNPTDPNARYNRSLILLTEGNYQQGFPEYEWRLKTREFPPCPFRQPLWDGSDLTGRTILLHAEQGLGDTLQFIRYAALVKQRGARIVLTCHQPLMRLLSTVPGIDQLVPLGYPPPNFDVYAPLMSLPGILGTTLENVPAPIPYLQPPQSALQLSAPATARLKVGIVWSGGHLYKKNQSRSCPLVHFQPLLQLPDIAYYSLQKGIAQTHLSELGWESQVQDLSSQFNDMAETAAAIAQLDLVITVDTSIAHLAGALGKPVWVLLTLQPDWRWMLHREETPWYPTMRLFRQSKLNDWQGVLDRVVHALKSLPVNN
ncbi:tetratricopeptide repeat protein [Phormidium sp. FACHB-592]|uniref:Tetratricopeptide repeat protein n=1 Tax=Stenomitos frigidus AS-A4 TaxID=2933935 RepID=A0ABV0KSP9_9CYAN|nr:tetratricopeptide repeat protein [Phormidium sp. FACHB-592]